MRSSLLVAVSVLSLPIAAQELAPPAFGNVALDRLACRVVRAESSPIGTTRVVVEVTNRSELAAEPTVFHCEWKDGRGTAAAAEVARVPLPRVARVGRLVPPQKSVSYAIQLPVAEAKGLRIAVAEALFSDAPGIDRSPVEVVRLVPGNSQLRGARVQSTAITLRNRLPHVVDVVLRARFTAPKDAEVLVTATVGRSVEGAVEFQRLPVALEWGEELGGYDGARIQSAEVVDWSARLVPDPAPARALLERAYQKWLRLETGGVALRGRFRTVRESVYEAAPVKAEGTFVVDAAGKVSTQAETPAAAALGKAALPGLLEPMQRPTLQEILRDNEIQLLAPGLIAVRGPGWTAFRPAAAPAAGFAAGPDRADPEAQHIGYPTWRIDGDGRFAALGWLPRPDMHRLRTRPMGEGYVIVEESSAGGAVLTERDYQWVGGIVVPTLRRHTMKDALGKVLIREECRVFDLAIDTSPTAPPGAASGPAGPGVEALRALWDRVYRYPAGPVELSARFATTNPGTDLTWLGLRKVDGAITLRGFSGWHWNRPGWTATDAVIDGKVTGETAAALGFAFMDRVVLWKGRDPCAYDAFDAQFAGVEIRHAAGGREAFELAAGPLREVVVEGGRIRSLRMSSGLIRRFTWKETPAGLVPERIETGEEVITAKWQEVAKGWWLPVDIEFRRVFGRDWGPETLRLTNVRVK